MVVVGTGTVGSKYLDKDWPIDEGLVAGTTKQTTDSELKETK